MTDTHEIKLTLTSYELETLDMALCHEEEIIDAVPLEVVGKEKFIDGMNRIDALESIRQQAGLVAPWSVDQDDTLPYDLPDYVTTPAKDERK